MSPQEKNLQEIEKNLTEIYSQAQSDLNVKWKEYMDKVAEKGESFVNEITKAKTAGDTAALDIANKKFKDFLTQNTLTNKYYKDMVDQVTTKLADVNSIALNYINGTLPKTYTMGFNDIAESTSSLKGYSFNLVDENTVKDLVTMDSSLLPTKTLNVTKDKLWNTKSINSQVTQGIIQGESVPKIAKRLQTVTDMNKASSIRNARTMTTSAECRGRLDSYKEAKLDGVNMKKVWMSAHDERTRAWHSDLNGVEADVDSPFHSDYGEINYPGDPAAHPANVYNCRCTMKAKVIGFLPKSKTQTAETEIVDKSFYSNKKMSNVYEELKQEDTALANKFYKELKAEGKPSEVWQQYLDGTLSQETTAKIDNLLAQHKNVSATPIISKSGTKKIETQLKLKAEFDNDSFYELGDSEWQTAMDAIHNLDDMNGLSYSEYWYKYIHGEIKNTEFDKLFKEKVVVKTVTTTTVEKSSELIKAEAEVTKAKNALEQMPNKTYSGIWKNDVSLSDYEAKKASIAAKKAYYQDYIDYLDTTFNDLEDWQIQDLVKYKQYLADLNEFEDLGKQYSKAQEAYVKAVEEVKRLTPVDTSALTPKGETFAADAYTDIRKNNAVWAKTTKTADKHLRQKCGEVWKNATSDERNAIYNYTSSYHKFNEPLRGIEYGTNIYKGVGNTDLDAGYTHNGKALNAMTSIIDKSTYDEDFWLQRGVNYNGMDKFFGVDQGLFRYGTQQELETALLGTTPTEYGFMSAGVAKGKGFNSCPIIMNVYAPSGTKMMYAEPFSAYGNGAGSHWDGVTAQSSFGSESEIILQQGTKFRVTKVERAGTGTVYIDMEVIAQDSVQLFNE